MQKSVKSKTIEDKSWQRLHLKFQLYSLVDPENVDFVIPGNDDAIRSIEVVATAIADACLKGLGKRKEVEDGENQE